MKQGANTGGFLLTLIAGLAIGAVAGVLMAPCSGKTTRKRLFRKAEDTCEDLSEAGRKIAQMGKEIYDRSQDVAEDLTRFVGGTKSLFKAG